MSEAQASVLSDPALMPEYIVVGKELFMMYRLEADPFGIYKSRRALAKQFPHVQVYRGDEWWHTQ